MSIDNRIKHELDNESENLDELLNETEGMFDLAMGSLKTGLRRWMFVVSLLVLTFSGLMLWCCYEFFVAESLDDRVFWGVWFVASLFVQGSLKLWQWMEINRSSLLREVKRVEISVARLITKLEDAELM
jgi:hypothetical protein